MRRDWTEARAKVEAEGACRACGRSDRRLEAAHIIGRARDERRGKTAIVHPDSIVPLCGPAVDSDTCHGLYDSHALDLLPHLHLSEQVRAVADAGGIEAARRRVCGREPSTDSPSGDSSIPF